MADPRVYCTNDPREHHWDEWEWDRLILIVREREMA